MTRDQVRTGVLLKLLSDYFNVPAGTWATVESAGTITDGTWFFAVKWWPYKPTPRAYIHTASSYSLNLWEQDLSLFEVVTPEEEQAAMHPKPASSTPPPVWHREQLRLPFGDY